MIFDRFIPASFRRWYARDAVAGVLYGVYAGLTVPFTAIVARRMGGSSAQVAVVIAAAYGAMLLIPLWHRATAGRNPALVVGWFGLVGRAFLLPLAWVRDIGWYLACLVSLACIEAAGIPAYAEVMKGIYPDTYRGRAMAFIRVEMGVAMLACAVLGGKLIDLFGFQVVFPVAGVFGIASSLVFLGLARAVVPADRHDTDAGGSPFQAFADRSFVHFLAVISLAEFAVTLAGAVYPLFYVDRLAASNFHIGLLSGVTECCVLGGFFLWGTMIDRGRIGPARVWCYGTLFSVPLIFLGVDLFGLRLRHLLPAAAAAGLGRAGMDLLVFNSVIGFAPTGRAAAYMTAQLFLAGAIGILGPFAGSALASGAGFTVAFATAAGLLGLCTLMLMRLRYAGVAPVRTCTGDAGQATLRQP